MANELIEPGSLVVPQVSASGFPLVEKYVIYGQTGCTCCRNENFLEGWLDTLDEAIGQAKWYVKRKRVASQYSDTGIYYVYKFVMEKIDDKRLVWQDNVFQIDQLDLSGDEANSLPLFMEKPVFDTTKDMK